MSSETSARPARLLRHESTAQAIAEGLRRRATALVTAANHYNSTCGAEYRAPVAGGNTMVNGLANDLEDLGRWVGDVGRAVTQADLVACLPGGPNPDDHEQVFRVGDSFLLRGLRHWGDPYRGVRPGAGRQLAADIGVTYDAAGPPAWTTYLGHGGTVAGIAEGLLKHHIRAVEGLSVTARITLTIEQSSVRVLRNGSIIATYQRTELVAHLRLTGQASPRVHTATQWVGRLGSALGFVSGFANQWAIDADRSTGERVARATARGGVPVLAGIGAGALAGTACGPGAPVCSTVLGITGGIAAGFGADRFMNWLLNSEPKPGEYNLDAVRDAIAADDGAEIVPELQTLVDDTFADLLLENPVREPIGPQGPVLTICDAPPLFSGNGLPGFGLPSFGDPATTGSNQLGSTRPPAAEFQLAR